MKSIFVFALVVYLGLVESMTYPRSDFSLGEMAENHKPITNSPFCPKDPEETCKLRFPLECRYGQECCCGKCHSSIIKTCVPEAGAWITLYTEACLSASWFGCGDGPSAVKEVGGLAGDDYMIQGQRGKRRTKKTSIDSV